SPIGFERMDFDVAEWDGITVPSNWQMEGYWNMHYSDLWYNFPIRPTYVPSENPTGIYKRTFSLTDEWMREKVILRFHGVDSAFHVWVNGEEVGYSKGARITSEFDITSYVTSGDNDLTVRVYQWSDGTYLEDQDMWWLSGIVRDVEIYALPTIGIADFKVDTLFRENFSEAELQVQGVVRGNSDDLTLVYELIDERKKTVLSGKKKIENTFSIKEHVHNPKLWSAEDPNLYTLLLTVQAGGDIIEVIPQQVGFRQIDLKG